MFVALQAGDLGSSSSDIIYLDDQVNYRIPIQAIQGGSSNLPGGIGFGVHERGIYRSQLQSGRPGTREMLIPLLISGINMNAAFGNWKKVEDKLEQARDAQGPFGQGGRVVLVVQFSGASEPVVFDIVDGSLLAADLALPDGDVWLGGLLSLTVYPYTRARAVAYTVSGTIPALGSLYQAGIPGSVDSPMRFNIVDTGTLIAVPAQPTAVDNTTGGVLNANTTYSYRITGTTPSGETTVSTARTVTTSNNAVNTHSVTVGWALLAGATGYKVYGRTGGSELLVATVIGQNILSWVDTGAVTPAGAQPGANTARVKLSRVRAGRLALRPLASGDFTGIYSPTVAGSGGSSSDGTQYGANYIRLAGTASTYTTFAQAVSANGSRDNGLFGVYLAVRDSSPTVGYGGVGDVLTTPTVQSNAGSLLSGTYTFFTVAKNGSNTGQTSNQAAANVALVNAGGTQAVAINILFYDNDSNGDFRHWNYAGIGAVASTPRTIWDGSSHNVFDLSAATATIASVSNFNNFTPSSSWNIDAINLPKLPASNIMSVRVRFKLNANLAALASDLNNVPLIYISQSSLTNGPTSGIYSYRQSGTTSTYIVTAGSGGNIYGSNAVLNDGSWHVVEIVYDASGVEYATTMYIDGFPVSSGFTATANAPVWLGFGNNTVAGSMYIGEIVVADQYLGNSLTIAGGASVTAAWTPAANANAHDLFVSYDDGGTGTGWYKVALGAVNSYTLTQWPPPSATLQGYPVNTPVLNSQIRLQVAVNDSGSYSTSGPGISTMVANGEWELLFMGTYPLPYVVTPEGQGAPQWKLLFDAKNAGPVSANVDVCAVLLFPHSEEQLIAEAPIGAQSNGVLYTWQLDTRYDGLTSVLLVDGSNNIKQMGTPTGRLYAGPGDNKFHMIGEVQDQNGNYILDFANCKFTAQITAVEPRYGYAIGQRI